MLVLHGANGDQLRDIAALVDRGSIKPVIDANSRSNNCRRADLSRGGPGARKVFLKVR